MKPRTVALALATLLSVGLAVLVAEGVRTSRTDVELFWDDGSAEDGFSLPDVTELAVGFCAPETALAVAGMRVYIVDDGIPDPPDPQHPSTVPFTAWVRRIGYDGEPGFPASSGYMPTLSDSLFLDDTWVDVVFPEPVDISDESYFPEHRFYVAFEFESQEHPIIGLDLDPPYSGETFYWDWSNWVQLDTANAMIRAVVRDTSGTPVELESWGRVKSEYR